MDFTDTFRKFYKPEKGKEGKDWQDMYATESESDEEKDDPSTSPSKASIAKEAAQKKR